MFEYIIVAGAVVGILAAWHFGHDRSVRRELGSVAVSPIHGVTAGWVRVQGRARAAGEHLVAPGTERSCLAYSVSVFSDSEGLDHRVARFHRAVPFFIEDETGCARIEAPRFVTVMVGKDSRASGAVEDTSVQQLIRQREIDETGWGWRERSFRFEESVICEGDVVSVVGIATRELDPSLPPPGPRALPISVVVRDGGAEAPLLLGGKDWDE